MSTLEQDLLTPRLKLRHFTPEDADALFLLFSDPTALQYTRYNDVKTRPDFAKLFSEHFLANETAFAIQLRKEGTLLGFIEMHAGGILTYAIRREFWGHGYVPEAGRAFVSAMFETQKVDMIEGQFAAENPASGRVLTKMGLHRVGQMGPFKVPTGEEIIVIRYQISRGQWQQAYAS